MAAILDNPGQVRTDKLSERDWDTLLQQISKGKCTPFIGPEVCKGVYPSKPQRSITWAKAEDYPLPDRSELARVAQFLAVRDSEAAPILKLIEEFEAFEESERHKPPGPINLDEAHRVLAALPLPVYITTNYDNYMVSALEKTPIPRSPTREYCRWRKRMHGFKDVLIDKKPTPANPVVFHLYGYTGVAESLVVTENDFLKFLVNISQQGERIPAVIQKAIGGGSLLFLGYSLAEWDFRVLMPTLAKFLEGSLARTHISVQLVPAGKTARAEQIEKVTKFLNLYFERLDTKVYWGTCQEFVSELRSRWEDSDYAKRTNP